VVVENIRGDIKYNDVKLDDETINHILEETTKD
jgi:hypothetical protein